MLKKSCYKKKKGPPWRYLDRENCSLMFVLLSCLLLPCEAFQCSKQHQLIPAFPDSTLCPRLSVIGGESLSHIWSDQWIRSQGHLDYWFAICARITNLTQTRSLLYLLGSRCHLTIREPVSHCRSVLWELVMGFILFEEMPGTRRNPDKVEAIPQYGCISDDKYTEFPSSPGTPFNKWFIDIVLQHMQYDVMYGSRLYGFFGVFQLEQVPLGLTTKFHCV